MVNNYAANSAIVGIYRLLIIFFVIFTLYFAQTIVIPLTLAALLTFLLSPLVSRLEKWIGRVFSILLVVIVVFSTMAFAGYVFSRQLILFGTNFQNYSENVQKKLQGFQLPKWKILSPIEHSLETLKDALIGESQFNDVPPPQHSEDVKLIDLSANFTKLTESLFGSFFNIIATSGIVLLLVIFMLLNREDIRGRIIKLCGQRRISSTTSAMEEAGDRVSTYLYKLLVVNIGFGFSVSLGLYVIGIPSPILWGCFAAILRFIPYIGPWIAALIPIVLSFIITDTWSVPLETISFFILLEFLTAYVIEPFYYSKGTGVSSFALILAAIFWTWLWGPLGLLLSTPIMVCLVVLGQHVTNMKFLSVLLSHEQALTPAEEFYHRLLSYDSNETIDLVESYLKKDSPISLYDTVLIPTITQTEMDYRQDLIDSEKKEGVYKGIEEILEFQSMSEQKKVPSTEEPKINILCLPGRFAKDELGVNILCQLLTFESFNVQQTKRLNPRDIFELIEKTKPDVVCIGAVAPFVVSHTQYLCQTLNKRIPQIPILIGLWGNPGLPSESIEKLKAAGATKVVFSLSQTCETLQEMRTAKHVQKEDSIP